MINFWLITYLELFEKKPMIGTFVVGTIPRVGISNKDKIKKYILPHIPKQRVFF
jgi:hypothetical protein